MSTYLCPKGHESSESDYCSECGAKIGSSSAAIVPPIPEKVAAQLCPDCSAPHELHSGNFCEICGYNFVTKAHGELPMIQPVAIKVVAPLETVTTKQGEEESATREWEVVVTIEPSLRHPDSPEPPADQPPITIRLDKSTHLIGRTSQVRAVYPDIAIDFDDAVSHRHALIDRQPDNTFTLRDIGSSNGTQLNGVELKPMVDSPLKNGDAVTIGHWTKITIQALTQSVKSSFKL
ncbi:FHA domain-containing protein [Phormidesmis priestleyi ULC007]|uniref:FHA domain-containing protein n=1 Tax=Phormidesmis priestleyi ULC007 TaxID=1920490 RepID=A0A2T1DP16_9CYAN|nr:FHA domain-containing protein [Phormidesmis priestleyi]PSB22236.1 FHA domain-containing protein [Phormidesmis priestleyi ULC007]PZO52503.1 MAG: FHA domain-containing protein [Phormidesmis priestleyi]